MSEFKLIMPKLGESIREATITKWFVKEGDKVNEDDILLEVATDKVDSEIPSPVEGIVGKILFPENRVLPVGEVIALIHLTEEPLKSGETGAGERFSEVQIIENEESSSGKEEVNDDNLPKTFRTLSNRFYSPLVKKIAVSENLSLSELESVKGSGAGGRVQKKDLLEYLRKKENTGATVGKALPQPETSDSRPVLAEKVKTPVSVGPGDQILEMDRVRRLIADHMVMSKQVSPHVTTVVEADVTNLVLWRNKSKDGFMERHGVKLTYMPVFIEAVARALSEFPMVNSSVDGDRIILRKNVNIGVAVAKPDGNLIVPVIKEAGGRNLVGLAKEMNRLAEGARNNKLLPEEIQEGTFTITNFGSFRNLIGTPIINQPQVAILATGSIEKKPAVLELPTGDVIAVRHKMFLSLSYDHRIVDGALGGAFLRRIADILEEFDINRSV